MAGWPLGNLDRDDTDASREGVGEHVSGIADQRNAIGEHAADYFHDHHASGDSK